MIVMLAAAIYTTLVHLSYLNLYFNLYLQPYLKHRGQFLDIKIKTKQKAKSPFFFSDDREDYEVLSGQMCFKRH